MLFLSETEVTELFPMEAALDRVQASFIAQAHNDALNQARRRLYLSGVSLHYMAAAWLGENLLGMKIYTVSRAVLRFIVLLYAADTGELLAMIEADHLGRLRTGAASGVATRHLSRADASRLAIIGSGRQAETQLEAISRVRKLRTVSVFSRSAERREQFCRRMTKQLGLAVEPAASAENAVRSSDIVVTATSAREPVLRGEWLNPGMHLNVIGANVAGHREVDEETLSCAAVIAVDSREQAEIEAGDLIQGFERCPERWKEVIEFKDIASGLRPGRVSAEQITIFKSTGIALWDIAAAGAVYRQALERGAGKQIELS